ncbi:olfactory receptor 2B2-like [Sarcophilus harrisii]
MTINQTLIREFILMGFSVGPDMRMFLFGLFSLMYVFTLLGNGVILVLICLDSKLHTPMYFFLSHLAIVDISYACNTVPQMLANLLDPLKPVSYAGCLTQTFLFLTFAHTECLLLVVMSYDRYVAICHPLRYSVIMSWRVCITLALTSWALGYLLALVHLILLLPLPFCGPQKINHFFCEILAVLKLACADTHINEILVLAGAASVLIGPFFSIVISYMRIICAILQIQSGEGRQKAFSTCSSHLCVVGLFYGTAIIMYIGPKHGNNKGQQKYLLLFHSLFNPMLNPLIYSLRNNEVKGALKRVLGKETLSMINNQTVVKEFILMGFPVGPDMRMFLLGLFSLLYAFTLMGNGVILGLISLEARLHTPMYFFLSHLAIVDISYACNTVPQMLANLLDPVKPISYPGCLTQTFLFLTFALTECLLLVVMSYDRYVAICHPLRYTVIMNWRMCISLALTSWALGFLLAMVHMILLLKLPFCGPREINHFFCQIMSLFKLACADTRLNQLVMFSACVFVLVGPFSLILISYIHILYAILRIQSGEGRKKAFSTCSSHLCVVGLFYGRAIILYMTPKTSHPEEQQKILSLFYSLINPMMNPLIYSLRNVEVKGALRRVLGKKNNPKTCDLLMTNYNSLVFLVFLST